MWILKYEQTKKDLDEEMRGQKYAHKKKCWMKKCTDEIKMRRKYADTNNCETKIGANEKMAKQKKMCIPKYVCTKKYAYENLNDEILRYEIMCDENMRNEKSRDENLHTKNCTTKKYWTKNQKVTLLPCYLPCPNIQLKKILTKIYGQRFPDEDLRTKICGEIFA